MEHTMKSGSDGKQSGFHASTSKPSKEALDCMTRISSPLDEVLDVDLVVEICCGRITSLPLDKVPAAILGKDIYYYYMIPLHSDKPLAEGVIDDPSYLRRAGNPLGNKLAAIV